MNEVLTLVIAVFMMFILHEVTHYLSLILLRVKFKTFIISRKSIGFIVDNHYLKDDKNVFIFFLSPISLSLSFLIDPGLNVLIFFSILNLLWSLSDILMLVRILRKPTDKRIEWADRWDEEALDKYLFKKSLTG